MDMIICKKILFVISAVLFALVGCSANHKQQVNKETGQNNEELVEQFQEDNVMSQSSGMIGYGFSDDSPDQFVYEGEAVEIPYYIENMGEDGENHASIGLLLFVNGEVQPFSVDGKEAVIHKFSISPGERKEINLSFFPVSGKEGEKIGVIPATIWNPDFIPVHEERPNFGNCLKLGCNIPLTIQMKTDGKMSNASAQTDAEIMDIPEEILAAYDLVLGEDDYDIMDSSVGFTIAPTKEKVNLLEAKDGKADITINLYGGKQVTDKITVFVNNEPVKIDDGDYVEVKTKKGKMWEIKFSLDVSAYGKLNTIYAVAMASGEDYVVSDIYQSNRLLLVNRTVSPSGTVPVSNDWDKIQSNGEKTDEERKMEGNLWLDFDYNYKSNCLELTDLGNGKVIKDCHVGKKENIVAAFQWKEGYAVAKQTLRKKRKDKSAKGIYIVDTAGITKENVNGYELIFYDKDLNQTRKIEILDAIHKSGLEELLSETPVLNWAGTKMVWLSLENQLLCLDLQTGDYIKSNAFLEKDIEVNKLEFVDDEKLAFIGDEGETDACYGYLSLSDETLFLLKENDYHASMMHINGQYLCVNDSENPNTHSSSGRVLVLDCVTDEKRIFEVDGLESTMAAVTADGKYMIAVKRLGDCEFLIRKYDYKTGKRLYEKNFSKSENIKPDQIMRAGDQYAVTYFSALGKGIACEIGVE